MAGDTAAGETGSLEFGILGSLQASISGRPLLLGGPRQRAVLALLLLEANRFVSMDRLAEDVWAGQPPPGWVTTLQTYVFHLRRALEPDRAAGIAGAVLVTTGRGYLLRVDRARLDADRFQDRFDAGRAALEAGRPAEAAQTLRQALDLWRGPVLADLADYAFTRPEAARLGELRLAALEARIDADLALGRHDALAGELDRLATEYPLRERLHGQLMLALYRCGRQADALAAFRRVRDLLADELGIDPGEPLQRLHAAVLAHDPALDWNAGPVSAGAEDARVAAMRSSNGSHGERPRGRIREPARARWRARRMLATAVPLAVAAVACIVAVARPWEAASATGLPGDSVGLVDLSGERVGAPVSVGSPAGLAYGAGSVWVVDSTEDSVSRINPVTHTVIDQVTVGSSPTAVTVTGQDVWVTNSGDGTVSEINATVNKVIQTIPVGTLPVAIASGPSGVWVANEFDDTVQRIDRVTGHPGRPVQVGGLPDGIAVGPGAVWVANGQDGTVQQIDPATLQPGGPVSVGAGPEGIAITRSAVWVANSLSLTVSKLDPATDQVVGTVRVGDGPGALAIAGGSVWVSNKFSGTLDRIDPRAVRVDRVLPLGSLPQGLTASGPDVWVAALPGGSATHRGGTLTYQDGVPFPYADPVQAFSSSPVVMLSTVYDGLVAFRRAGLTAGLTLVPDLASSLPRPADAGLTYTFTLRSGIRYSNGQRVRASDFRRGLERELRFGAPVPYYQDIVGAPACRPASCDLSTGIVTNDSTGRITFRLSRPDPDFIYGLALLLAVPAPRGAPGHLIQHAPFMPGTGPYMIYRFRSGQSLVLVRNKHFRQWSYAAQPAGYPDVLTYLSPASDAAAVTAVNTGRADVSSGYDESIAIQYPSRVYPGLKLGDTYAFLNTRRPPFSNLKARQAINYAVDRARILQLLQADSRRAVVTCQIIPQDFPAHQNYCPYTSGTEDGTWRGPDLPKAIRLARESRTTNVPVTVWVIKDSSHIPVGSYLVRLLEKLGYRARLRAVSAPAWFTAAANRHGTVQIAYGGGWDPDYFAPATYFLSLLSCAGITTGSNYSGFCDPVLDRLIREAQAAQATDAAMARRLWAQADRIATNQAPLIMFFNSSVYDAFVSGKVHNYQASPVYGPLLDQMWVR